jgi:hypothetical protein
MKQLLLIALTLISLNATACNDHGKSKKKAKCSLPPLELRCTMEGLDGKWCRGWSVRGEEYCWKCSPYKRELKEARDKAKLRMKK